MRRAARRARQRCPVREPREAIRRGRQRFDHDALAGGGRHLEERVLLVKVCPADGHPCHRGTWGCRLETGGLRPAKINRPSAANAFKFPHGRVRTTAQKMGKKNGAGAVDAIDARYQQERHSPPRKQRLHKVKAEEGGGGGRGWRACRAARSERANARFRARAGVRGQVRALPTRTVLDVVKPRPDGGGPP